MDLTAGQHCTVHKGALRNELSCRSRNSFISPWVEKKPEKFGLKGRRAKCQSVGERTILFFLGGSDLIRCGNICSDRERARGRKGDRE